MLVNARAARARPSTESRTEDSPASSTRHRRARVAEDVHGEPARCHVHGLLRGGVRRGEQHRGQDGLSAQQQGLQRVDDPELVPVEKIRGAGSVGRRRVHHQEGARNARPVVARGKRRVVDELCPRAPRARGAEHLDPVRVNVARGVVQVREVGRLAGRVRHHGGERAVQLQRVAAAGTRQRRARARHPPQARSRRPRVKHAAPAPRCSTRPGPRSGTRRTRRAT